MNISPRGDTRGDISPRGDIQAVTTAAASLILTNTRHRRDGRTRPPAGISVLADSGRVRLLLTCYQVGPGPGSKFEIRGVNPPALAAHSLSAGRLDSDTELCLINNCPHLTPVNFKSAWSSNFPEKMSDDYNGLALKAISFGKDLYKKR